MVIETSQKHTFEIHEWTIDEIIWMAGIDPEDVARTVDDVDGVVWGTVNGAIINKIDSFWEEAWIT